MILKRVQMENFIRKTEQIGFVMTHHCLDPSEVKLNKQIIQDSYTFWSNIVYDKSFLNWGIWDKKVHQDFMKLHYNYLDLDNKKHDINSILLMYYIVKPLIDTQFFNKRLLDVGCGNGIGLKILSQLLHTKQALGIDLTHNLVLHGHHNFYFEDKVNYIQSDAEQLPLENESIDIVTNVESSHNYPKIEHFYDEVERILAPGGYFCFTDSNVPNKSQMKQLDAFLKNKPQLKLIKKQYISKMVQASIHQRVIKDEDWFYEMAINFLGKDSEDLALEMLYLAYAMGLVFLPWWKIRFKRPELRYLSKAARKVKFWGKKEYFYYLIQKNYS